MAEKRNGDRVLVADDDQNIRYLLEYTLHSAGFEVVLAEDGRQAVERLDEGLAVAVLDLKMPHLDGIACLETVQKRFPEIQVIIITANNEIEVAVDAMKKGAFDYITKPFNPDELVSLVAQAAKVSHITQENRQLRTAISDSMISETFIGDSTAARDLLGKARKIASLDSTVLITGPSGVGKSVLARHIHSLSPRAEAPMVTVNCTALPHELVESELFGHERGAFTGAHEQRMGRVEMANGGTLFLDEVGDMPLDLQPKLLNFIQERRFTRVGGQRVIDADVRIIAATNQDLEELCEEKKFREDLYYRLNVLPLHIPPLNERPEDIPLLVEHFLANIARRRQSEPYEIADQARMLLNGYDWPGNIRELENVLERASAFCEDNRIEVVDLPTQLRETRVGDQTVKIDGNGHDFPFEHLRLDEIERIAIERMMLTCNGNKKEAARRLGISEKTIYNKMARHGLVERYRVR